MQNVHGCQETDEPEKLYYETLEDNGDGSRGNKEGTSRKSEKSPRRKRRRTARTFGYHKGRSRMQHLQQKKKQKFNNNGIRFTN